MEEGISLIEETEEKTGLTYTKVKDWKLDSKGADLKPRITLRDKNGALILPLIMLKRVSVEKSDVIPGYEHDIRRKYTEIVRKSGWSKDNRYSNKCCFIG